MIQSSRPFHRLTTSPTVRLITLTQLLDFVCSFHCPRHNRPVSVQQVMNGRMEYAACCEDLLDLVERALGCFPPPPSHARGEGSDLLM